ncbi:hypothetical protein BLNAU_9628 [Blattamonas nauphoetae]|uniref:Uncharacterized protein n=1 Tax=Blattamonas nauphoetae TaxID=2049346 RepID=A0ABQ9XR47_9EUKA|nr:hypothetical protein BLNAU_11128 [Blattamonas nauphoetae]KAK2955400.1 hypothetical protein BLNAU_9628 [Blattamonas nauphoetae]
MKNEDVAREDVIHRQPLHLEARLVFPVIDDGSTGTAVAAVLHSAVKTSEHGGKSTPSILITKDPPVRQGTKLRYRDIA